jgi:hypothetical protein
MPSQAGCFVFVMMMSVTHGALHHMTMLHTPMFFAAVPAAFLAARSVARTATASPDCSTCVLLR